MDSSISSTKMKVCSREITMRCSFINVFLCMLIFSLAPPIPAGNANADNETTGYLTCKCGTVLNKSLDVATLQKLNEMFNLLSTIKDVGVIPVYSGLLTCVSCEIGDISCKEGKLAYSVCGKRTLNFKVFSRKRNATEKSYLKIIAKGPHAVHKDPLVIDILLGSEEKDGKIVVKRSVQSFPKIIDIPIGGLKNNQRQLRQLATCIYPRSSETSAINCRLYPSSIKCVQRCAFGYTFKYGISRELHCQYKENKWMPSGFKECQPFVDCSVSLISGGSTNCSSPSLTKGPECQIECLKYEDKKAIPEGSYSCDINGNWTPKLPFCVVARSDLVLVKAPKKKTHNDN